MVFKNEKELEKFLLAKCQDALLKAQGEVYTIIKKFLDKFYADYDPIVYQRTNQLLNSLVRSRVVPDGKGYKAEVYFDLNYIYRTGSYPTGEQVMEAATQGLHGAIGKMPGDDGYFRYVDGRTGVDPWVDPMVIIDAKAIEILKDMLKAEGIPIK